MNQRQREDEMDEVHAELQRSNAEHLILVQRQGVQVGGLLEHYTLTLLEHLVGDQLENLKVKHELWVADQLDGIQAKITEAKLLAPASFPIAKPGR